MKVRPPSPSAGELQRLYEGALAEQRARYGAPDVTLDAIIHQLRESGLAALADPDCQHRLALCKPDQIGEVIERLDRIRGKWPAITDQLLTKLGELR